MRRLGKTPPFRGPHGELVPGSIAEVGYRQLGGLGQWVMIRGESVANPALILLHGGPGLSESEEIVAVMRALGDRADGCRLRALIVLLWRAGLRISEALALQERDLEPGRGQTTFRRRAPVWNATVRVARAESGGPHEQDQSAEPEPPPTDTHGQRLTRHEHSPSARTKRVHQYRKPAPRLGTRKPNRP